MTTDQHDVPIEQRKSQNEGPPFIFRLLNPIMKMILKSPIHSIVSDRIMIITFTGLKTGIEYSTPVSYLQEDQTVYCFTHGRWWMNLKGGAVVRLRIRGREFEGKTEPISEDKDQIAKGLGKLLNAVPGDARYYNVALDPNGNPDEDDLLRAADNTTMVVVRLEE